MLKLYNLLQETFWYRIHFRPGFGHPRIPLLLRCSLDPLFWHR